MPVVGLSPNSSIVSSPSRYCVTTTPESSVCSICAIYAICGNTEAARLSGIPVDTLRASTYVMTAICSGIGGMILASRLGVGQADMGGSIALDSSLPRVPRQGT